MFSTLESRPPLGHQLQRLSALTAPESDRFLQNHPRYPCPELSGPPAYLQIVGMRHWPFLTVCSLLNPASRSPPTPKPPPMVAFPLTRSLKMMVRFLCLKTPTSVRFLISPL